MSKKCNYCHFSCVKCLHFNFFCITLHTENKITTNLKSIKSKNVKASGCDVLAPWSINKYKAVLLLCNN